MQFSCCTSVVHMIFIYYDFLYAVFLLGVFIQSFLRRMHTFLLIATETRIIDFIVLQFAIFTYLVIFCTSRIQFLFHYITIFNSGSS
jgi:hypothetical protein